MKTKAITPRIILSTLSLLISVLVAEGAVRVLARQSLQVRFLATAGSQQTKGPFTDFQEYIDSISSSIGPHRTWLGQKTNSWGFNDDQWTVVKGKDVYRIASIGDSFVFGFVNKDSTAQKVMEDALQSHCGATEVLNLGVPATGLWDYKTMLELAGRTFNPDLFVVHLYLGNDGPDLIHNWDDLPRERLRVFDSYLLRFVRNNWSVRMAARSALSPIDVAIPSSETDPSPSAEAVSMYSHDAYRKVLADELGRFYSALTPSSTWKSRLSRTLEVLKEIQKVARSQGKKLALVMYPSRVQVEPEARHLAIDWLNREGKTVIETDFELDGPAGEIIRFAESESLPVFDTTPSLLSIINQGFTTLYIERDSHFNLIGNRKVAEIQAEFLAKTFCRSDQ